MDENKRTTYEGILRALAPCGIDCARCVSYVDGDVVKLSSELKERLHGFERMAEKTKGFAPIMNQYGAFSEMLEHFTKGSCTGCRYGDSPNCMCAAKDCHKEKGVDFCFECEAYPCDKNSYNAELEAKWRSNNDAMKAEGVEAFYKNQVSKSRY